MVAEGADVSLQGCQVVNNTALSGAGVYLRSGAAATVEGSLLVTNTASGGGAIYAERGTSVTVVASTLKNNTAAVDGAAVYATGAKQATLTSVVLAYNQARQGRGGGLFSQQRSVVTITNSTVASNTAAQGGGVYLVNSYVQADSTLYTGNKALISGGAVAVAGLDSSAVSSDSVTDAVLHTSCVFKSNTAVNLGGGVQTSGEATVVRLSKSLVQGCSASAGGGVASYGRTDFGLSGVVFKSNEAELQGGAVVIQVVKNASQSLLTGISWQRVALRANTASFGAVYWQLPLEPQGPVSPTQASQTVPGGAQFSSCLATGGCTANDNDAPVEASNAVAVRYVPPSGLTHTSLFPVSSGLELLAAAAAAGIAEHPKGDVVDAFGNRATLDDDTECVLRCRFCPPLVYVRFVG